MVAVADTSPINYLILIAQIDLLKQTLRANFNPTCRAAGVEEPRRAETGP